MDTSERGRKRRDVAGPREEQGSVPPPARRKRERHELDPENLWDKETDDTEETEGDEEGGEDGDFEEETQEETASYEDLDDWDHPVRRLKIN
jgi:phosphopantothenoylcysteine synthetase/decarboxylase